MRVVLQFGRDLGKLFRALVAAQALFGFEGLGLLGRLVALPAGHAA